MRRIIILILAGLFSLTGFSQADFPPYPVPARYKMKSSENLPVRLNNAELKYFPPIVNQYGWTCNQASSIGYIMTYEMSRLRDLDASEYNNQYPPLFVFNYLSKGRADGGISYFDTWEVVKAAGCPTNEDFPYWKDPVFWMSGYDKYYRAMQNRIIENYSIHVGNPEGLKTLKQFLLDRLDDQEYGGLANIQIASGGMEFRMTGQSSSDPNAPVLISFGEVVGHALTVVGYDDEIGVDLNSDGLITNDRDITGDDIVDMRDWEKGALILANTWGKGWGRDGFAYCLYSVLTREGNNGGIWNKSVHVIKPVKQLNPLLTMRLKLKHTSRNKIKITAGVSDNMDAGTPDRLMGFPHFNYHGGDEPLVGENPADSTEFEIGLDISSLVSDYEPGQELKFFLMLEEYDLTSAGDGEILEFSVISYEGEKKEFISDQAGVNIVNNGTTVLTVDANVNFNKIRIKNPEQNSVNAGELYTSQLEADGGEPPYLWELVQDYEEVHYEEAFPDVSGVVLSSSVDRKQFIPIELPFSFPYYGKDYESLIVDEDGALHFETVYFDYPYSVDGSLAFQVRKSIIPFGCDVELIDEDDLISYESTNEYVRIFWEGSVMFDGQQYKAQVGTYLYPDGKIEFHYGEFTFPQGDMYEWMAGISNGDGRLFMKATVSELKVLFKNYGARFEPHHYPGEVRLTTEGLLSCRPENPNEIWNIYVRVRDKNNQITTGAIPISTINWENTRMLGKSAPNPFRDITKISFLVDREQQVVLKIYDTSGRAVKDIVNETLPAGEYVHIWDGTDYRNKALNPGMYFYRLEIGEEWEVGKVILLAK